MDCSTPGSSVLHYLPEFAQTHVHWVSDAIQPSHPLSSPSLLPSIFPSIRQGVFQWVSSFHQVAKVLELQHQFLQWLFRTDFLSDWLVWCPCSPRDSQESSPTLQFKGINSSTLSLFYCPVLTSVLSQWTQFIKNRWEKQSCVCLQSFDSPSQFGHRRMGLGPGTLPYHRCSPHTS